ncbi:MAG: PEP-CTERM sorting domain-containing protein [Cyanobacteria bacterium P01_H01_bin.15]
MKFSFLGIAAFASPLVLSLPAAASGIVTQVRIPIPNDLIAPGQPGTPFLIEVTPGDDIVSTGGFLQSAPPISTQPPAGPVQGIAAGTNPLPGFTSDYFLLPFNTSITSLPSPDISGNIPFLTDASLSLDLLGNINIALTSGSLVIPVISGVSSIAPPIPNLPIPPENRTFDISNAIDAVFGNPGNDGTLGVRFSNPFLGTPSDPFVGIGVTNVVIDLEFEFPHETVPEPGTILGTMFVLGLGVWSRRKTLS